VSKPLIAILTVALVLIAGVVGFMIGDRDQSQGTDEPAVAGTTGETGSTGTTDLASDEARLNGLNLTAYTTEGYAGTQVEDQLQTLKDLEHLGHDRAHLVHGQLERQCDQAEPEEDTQRHQPRICDCRSEGAGAQGNPQAARGRDRRNLPR